ncbi:MAG: hypothetical protein EPN97_17220 [Alphaproteobacteria bacterium]|nr:MAG: hypothetical protein EPN97_17220 [Alphaproteobacteria bacterium]
MTQLNNSMDLIMLSYGKTCYVAQNFESTIRTLLVVLRSQKDKQPVTPNAILEIEKETHRKVLGVLFYETEAVKHFSADERKIVIPAIEARNHIMHGFWDENIKLFLMPEGTNQIVMKLDALRSTIKQADEIVVARIDQLWAQYGLSTETFKMKAKQIAEFAALDEYVIKH